MQNVVTGGAGLIGSHLVRRLLQEGREVLVVDDFSRGSIENLSYLGADVESKKIDLRNYSETLKAIEGAEVVFHLAAIVGGLEYLHGSESAEINAFLSNISIDSNVFSACLEAGVKRLIYTSSVSVYPIHTQRQLNVTFCEDELPLGSSLQSLIPSTKDPLPMINPDGGYGWAKLMGEIALAGLDNLKVGIARIFNIYGEGEDLGETTSVIPAIIRKAIQYPRENVTVWGDGTQTRDFLYVSDCVDALLKLDQKVYESDESSYFPIVVNIGSDISVPISVLAEKIIKVSGRDLKIKYDAAKPVGPLSRTANITKIKELLGWQPKTSLDEGLRYMYAWAEKMLRGI